MTSWEAIKLLEPFGNENHPRFFTAMRLQAWPPKVMVRRICACISSKEIVYWKVVAFGKAQHYRELRRRILPSEWHLPPNQCLSEQGEYSATHPRDFIQIIGQCEHREGDDHAEIAKWTDQISQ